MAKSIAIFAAINFAIIGLSHIFQSQGWRDFFRHLHSMGRAGAFANGMITLLMGSLIVSCHNIWNGPPTVLTLVGWGYLAKSGVIFLYPQWNLRSMASVESSSDLKLRSAGVVLLGLAVLICWCVASGQYAP